MSATRISPSRHRRTGRGTSIITRLAVAIGAASALVPAAAQAAPSPAERVGLQGRSSEIGLSRAALDGRLVSVTARCTGTRAHLQLTGRGGAKLGTATAQCRGTTRLRVTLPRSAARRLAAPDAPDVRVTVRSGAARDSAWLNFARVHPPTKGRPKARAAAYGMWRQVRANCYQITYGNPPWSLFVQREINFSQAGETFGYRYGTPVSWRGMAQVPNPNGTSSWIFLNSWTSSVAGYSGTWSKYSLPLSHSGSGWVRPVVQLDNGEWNYTIAEGSTQAIVNSGWCYFPVPS